FSPPPPTPPPSALFPYTTLFRSAALRSLLNCAATCALAFSYVAFACASHACFCWPCWAPHFAFATSYSPSALVSAALRCARGDLDRKSTRLNSSHVKISYAVFCL